MGIAVISSGFAIAIIAMAANIIKLRKELIKPRNNVHFYVYREVNGRLKLCFRRPMLFPDLHKIGRGDIVENLFMEDKSIEICDGKDFHRFGLSVDSYIDLEYIDGAKEVYLNLEE